MFLEIDTPPGVPDDPPRTNLVPPLRIDRRIGKLVLLRTSDGSLHAEENFLLDALYGTTAEGPLELRRIDCPADAPP